MKRERKNEKRKKHNMHNISIPNHELSQKHARRYLSSCPEATTYPHQDPDVQSLRQWGSQLKGH
ncbi:hypothetical protein CR513_57562, partial [Mucuna pruriens]